MKNISITLNILLIVAVAFLYYKVYQSTPVSAPVAISGSGMPSNAIVFINSDTLLTDYNYFNVLKTGLEKKQDSVDNLLQQKAKLLDQEVKHYQARGAQMSPEERAREEERLMGKQQGLMDMKESLVGELQSEESAMNDSLHDNLLRYLKEYNKSKNYLYILGYQRGSGIMLANDSLDITQEVLKGLNKQ